MPPISKMPTCFWRAIACRLRWAISIASCSKAAVCLSAVRSSTTAQFYIEKMAQILKANNPKSLTVATWKCRAAFGLKHIAEEAMKLSGVHPT